MDGRYPQPRRDQQPSLAYHSRPQDQRNFGLYADVPRYQHNQYRHGVADEPPSPISFAAGEQTLQTGYSPVGGYNSSSASTPYREQPPPLQMHTFLNEPPPSQFSSPMSPSKSSSTAKSTFEDGDDRSTTASQKSKGGGPKIFKRVMKELTGGHKNDSIPEPVSLGQAGAKPKLVTYGRGGAGRIKKKKGDMVDAAKSTTSLGSDEMKNLKNASSKAAKEKAAVFDPYLKQMVGRGGMPVTPSAPTVSTTIPFPPAESQRTEDTQAKRLTPPTPDSTGYSRPPTASSRSGTRQYRSGSSSGHGIPWEGDSVAGESNWSGRQPGAPYSRGYAEGPYRGYPSPPPSEGRTPIPWNQQGPNRQPSDQSLRPNAEIPSIDLLQSLQNPRNPGMPLSGLNGLGGIPSAIGAANTSAPGNPALDFAALQALTTLLAQAPQVPAVPQPIIPHSMTGNIDGIIAAAAAYRQLANQLAAAAMVNPALATQAAGGVPQSKAAAPVPIPHEASPPKDDMAVLNAAMASYNLQATSTASSPSSISALSPPPHHRQHRIEQIRNRKTSSASSSLHGHPSPPAPKRTPSPPPPQEEQRLKPAPTFNRLMTPPITDDSHSSRGSRDSPLVEVARLSVAADTRNLTPSPAGSNLTFTEGTDNGKEAGVTYQDSPMLLPLGSTRNSPAPPVSHKAMLSALALDKTGTPDDDILSHEKEVARLEKTIKELNRMQRNLSSEALNKQYRAAEPSARPPPPQTARAPPPTRTNETEEEVMRRMNMALPPLPLPAGVADSPAIWRQRMAQAPNRPVPTGPQPKPAPAAVKRPERFNSQSDTQSQREESFEQLRSFPMPPNFRPATTSTISSGPARRV